MKHTKQPKNKFQESLKALRTKYEQQLTYMDIEQKSSNYFSHEFSFHRHIN